MSKNHFVRFLTYDQVLELAGMLRTLNEDIDLPRRGQDFYEARSPDGDLVLGALKHPSGKYIASLHREVFQEDTT